MTRTAFVSDTTCPSQTELGAYLDLDCRIQLPTTFTWEQAELQAPASIRARLVGPEHAPVVLVLGGISANRHVCDAPETGFESAGLSQESTGWWRDLVGPEKVLNTQRYRVLSFDFFPGDEECPESPLTVTPRDQARLAQFVCDSFGISQLHAFIGASYGGMIALNFGALFPERVKQVAVVCAAHRPHPMGTAWRSIQRKIVRLGLETGQPDRALSLARELGMTTYRTAQEFGGRFTVGAKSVNEQGCSDLKEATVETYLENRGQAFIGKMTPQRYLTLSQSIDLHDVNPGELNVPVTLVGFKQDQLVPLEEVRSLFQQLPLPAGYYEMDSIYGHDAFLKEIPFLTDIFKSILAE